MSERVVKFLEENGCSVYNSCDSDYSDCIWSSRGGCKHPDHPCNINVEEGGKIDKNK